MTAVGLVATAMRATTVAKTVVPSGRVVALAMVASLVALSLGAGGAAAHNPGGKQVSGENGPHYDGEDGSQTASQTAYVSNPNLESTCHDESRHPDHANSIHNRECSADSTEH